MKKRKHYTYDEKVALIKECRQSGMSDYQWCHKNNIPPSTFYDWIKQLRKNASSTETVIPKKESSLTVTKHDIVKLNVAKEPQEIICESCATEITSSEKPTIELAFNGCSIKIHNDVNPTLLAQTINIL